MGARAVRKTSWELRENDYVGDSGQQGRGEAERGRQEAREDEMTK